MIADSSNIRRSVIAGSWYPGDPDKLRDMIATFFDQVPPMPLEGKLVGLVVPHAGYVYSGQVAAFAYTQLRGKGFPRVVIVSPLHRMYPGRLAVIDKAYYETPLGLVSLDTDFLQAVERRIALHRVASDSEHSLEIQLPFLQYTLDDFALSPIMMGDQDWGTADELGRALADASTKMTNNLPGGVLLVASTDLSHFHAHEVATRLDQVVLDRITAYDPEGLARDLAARKSEACGGGPVMAIMVAARELGANRAVLLKYMTSGDVTGDRSNVVGYAAAALLRP
jgi:AmmeMemoRadiSam system protein B